MMAKEDIKKTLAKIVKNEDNTQKGIKSNTLKVSDAKPVKTIYIKDLTK